MTTPLPTESLDELHYCLCADTENCSTTLPGYVCRKKYFEKSNVGQGHKAEQVSAPSSQGVLPGVLFSKRLCDELRTIALQIETVGGWHIAALKVIGAAEEINRQHQEIELLRAALEDAESELADVRAPAVEPAGATCEHLLHMSAWYPGIWQCSKCLQNFRQCELVGTVETSDGRGPNGECPVCGGIESCNPGCADGTGGPL